MSNFVTKLEPNQVFVFGSNLQGLHIGGSARQAYEDFGAIWGIGVGKQGQSYAIPTMELPLDLIGIYIAQFIEYACLTPETEYLVTPVGTGIAGFKIEEIEPFFIALPTNITLLWK